MILCLTSNSVHVNTQTHSYLFFIGKIEREIVLFYHDFCYLCIHEQDS